MVVDGGNWGTGTVPSGDYVASESRRVAATAVLTSVVASKVSNKLTRSRARRASVEHFNELKVDDKAVQQEISIRRHRSRTLYAEKVKQKRLKKGLTPGSFALKAEMDAIAFTKNVQSHVEHSNISQQHSQHASTMMKAHQAEASEVQRHLNRKRAATRGAMVLRLEQRLERRRRCVCVCVRMCVCVRA